MRQHPWSRKVTRHATTSCSGTEWWPTEYAVPLSCRKHRKPTGRHTLCNGGGKQGGSRVWVGNAGPMLLLGRVLKASAALGYSRTASGRAPPRHFPSSLSDRARRSSYTRNRTVRSEVKAPTQGTAECSLPAHELRPGNARGRWGNMGFRGTVHRRENRLTRTRASMTAFCSVRTCLQHVAI